MEEITFFFGSGSLFSVLIDFFPYKLGFSLCKIKKRNGTCFCHSSSFACWRDIFLCSPRSNPSLTPGLCLLSLEFSSSPAFHDAFSTFWAQLSSITLGCRIIMLSCDCLPPSFFRLWTPYETLSYSYLYSQHLAQCGHILLASWMTLESLRPAF